MERLNKFLSAHPRLRAHRWLYDHQLWIEAFVWFNFVCLSLDIYLAHSTNQFRHETEYIPLYFSVIAPVVLLIGFIIWEQWGYVAVWRDLGHLVGWVAVLIGLTGVILHLDSGFFYERTIKSLTYAAPFAAPLAYTGLGLLLIMNRMVRTDSAEWAHWVLLLAVGGFVGNFVFSLTDHATIGFFQPVEWLPVMSSAFAVSFLLVPFFIQVSRRFLVLCALVLMLQALVGVLGFFLHAAADLKGPSSSLFQNIVNGAPPLAPLLFPNLVLLGLIALWVLSKHLPSDEASSVSLSDEGDAAEAQSS